MLNISIDEAVRKSFIEIIQTVDENGAVVILENNEPKYVLSEYKKIDIIEDVDDLIVEEVGEELIIEYLDVFKELAK